MPYANKDVDQPAHPRSLISAFVVRWLDRVTTKVGYVDRFPDFKERLESGTFVTGKALNPSVELDKME